MKNYTQFLKDNEPAVKVAAAYAEEMSVKIAKDALRAKSMDYFNFINQVIEGGIEGAKKSYSNPANTNHPLMLQGAIAGFEACRDKTPEQLKELLADAESKQQIAFREQVPDYWKHRCFAAEIEWTCNVVSAFLAHEGQDPITEITYLGIMRARDILKGIKE